jgi:hypothetical protein
MDSANPTPGLFELDETDSKVAATYTASGGWEVMLDDAREARRFELMTRVGFVIIGSRASREEMALVRAYKRARLRTKSL